MYPTEYYRSVRRNNSLVCYWRLNELSGNIAIDRAGKYNLNGIYSGAPVNSPALIYSVGNEIGSFSPGSKRFGIATEEVEVPDANPLHLTGGVTIEAWIIVFKSKQNAQVVSKMNSGGITSNPYNLRLREGKLSFGLGNGTTNVFVTAATEIPIGSPTHVVGSYSRKNLSIYINGENNGELNIGSQVLADGGRPLIICASTAPESTRFNGLVSEVAIYNAGISNRTAQEHFSLGRQIIYRKPYYITYDSPSYS